MSLTAEDTLHDTNAEAQWISLSDLMTGLMMVFMLIAIAFMIKVEGMVLTAPQQLAVPVQRTLMQSPQAGLMPVQQVAAQAQQVVLPQQPVLTKAQQVAATYQAIRQDMYNDLVQNFGKDLPGWGAEITKDLAVRFNEPDVLFNIGKADLKPRFQKILEDFFPRYVKIITSEKYKSIIQEIRIEGHTSSVWAGAATPEDAYYNNMELSQARTRSTLRFTLDLPTVAPDADWLRSHVTANGLSSSQLIRNVDGTEDMARSQRVEFRIRTDADSKMAAISESAK